METHSVDEKWLKNGKEINSMTDQQLNRALAELMGYTVYHYDKDVPERCYYMLVDPTGDYSTIERPTEEIAWLDAPWFTGDPATSLEVQTAACAIDKEGYIRNLVLVKWGESPILYSSVSNSTAADIACATPRERAEAAYITLQGAKGNG
ncbi:hypothetical protein HGO21_30190 [Acinetobacter sp. CUI P1]|nr:hypothetical protein [Acinetobacter sp. CUI P1]